MHGTCEWDDGKPSVDMFEVLSPWPQVLEVRVGYLEGPGWNACSSTGYEFQ